MIISSFYIFFTNFHINETNLEVEIDNGMAGSYIIDIQEGYMYFLLSVLRAVDSEPAPPVIPVLGLRFFLLYSHRVTGYYDSVSWDKRSYYPLSQVSQMA